MTRVLLLARPGDARTAYEAEIARQGLACEAVETVTDLHHALARTGVHGLLLDLVTLVQGNRAEKALVRELLDVYPVVRLRWNAPDGRISVLFYGQTQGGAHDLAAFAAECRAFPARRIRTDKRFATTLNVRLCRGEAFDEARAVRTVTLNLSEGGCFLFDADDWSGEATASMVVEELRDRTPIVLDVRWRVAWGTSARAPGIGVCYRSITPRQKSELRAINARAVPTKIVEAY